LNKTGLWICTLLLALPACSAEKQGYAAWGVNVQNITPGVYTAGVLNPDKTGEIASAGINAVINLRFPKESKYDEKPHMEEAGIKYVRFPIAGGVPAQETVAKFSSIVDQLAGQQILVHCASGNRVGILWAAHLLDQGMALDQAIEQVREVTTRKSSVKAIREYAQKYHSSE
jgi:uncharacterized protein (TIGR01244 family)